MVKTQWVSEKFFPKIYEAFVHIVCDNGEDVKGRYIISTKWSADRINTALGTLTPDELETLAIGFVDDQHEISKRCDALAQASALFAAFFEKLA
jgi:hypothetical protein